MKPRFVHFFSITPLYFSSFYIIFIPSNTPSFIARARKRNKLAAWCVNKGLLQTYMMSFSVHGNNFIKTNHRYVLGFSGTGIGNEKGGWLPPGPDLPGESTIALFDHFVHSRLRLLIAETFIAIANFRNLQLTIAETVSEVLMLENTQQFFVYSFCSDGCSRFSDERKRLDV